MFNLFYKETTISTTPSHPSTGIPVVPSWHSLTGFSSDFDLTSQASFRLTNFFKSCIHAESLTNLNG